MPPESIPPTLVPNPTPRQELLNLVHRLFLFGQRGAPRAVVFTGVGRGTGCTTVCAGAGAALDEQVDRDVCIVDGNLRSPLLHQHFGVDNSKGLTDAIARPGRIRDFARQVRNGKVWLLSSGSIAMPMPVLLSGSKLAERIREIRNEFKYVIIDAPSVNDYTDAILLGQMSDGVVLVLGSNSTRREVARRAKEHIESANVPVIGAVLNKREFPIPPFIYERL